VFVALGIQHDMRMRNIVCNLWPSGSTAFFKHYLINGTILEKKVIEHRMCFVFLYNFYLRNFSVCEEMSEI
jgi:hypothetical protein